MVPWSPRQPCPDFSDGGLQGVPQHQLPPQYQKILERLKVLEREISGGAMAVVAVLLNSKLYVANVGELPNMAWKEGRSAWCQCACWQSAFEKHHILFYFLVCLFVFGYVVQAGFELTV